jgi:thiol:disulfide interchange protein DsbD
MPEAIRKQDDFFGEVQIYKKSVSVDLPVIRTGHDAESLILKTVFQGCNEPIGVCYPPITKELQLEFPPVAETKAKQGAFLSSTPVASAPDTRSGLASLLEPGAGEDEFLPPDQAFQLIVSSPAADTVNVSLVIAEGYYLYKKKFAFESGTPGVSILPYQLPAGDMKEDEFLGRTEVYHVNFSIDLSLAGQSADGQFQLIAKYQGCAERGICYPPITKTVNLALAAGSGSSATSAVSELPQSKAVESPTTNDGPVEVSEEEGVIAMLSQGSIGTVIIGFFLFGLALSLTPCVFPMIPILSGIIVGQGADISRKRAFMLSVVYVAGMAIMYTIAGMLAGLTGELLSSAFQNPWVLGGSALVFVLLSFSMFGFYELQLPAWEHYRP